jgi:hypothetical protein
MKATNTRRTGGHPMAIQTALLTADDLCQLPVRDIFA